MRAVYTTANCTDAHRFANLLLQSGITATVESAPADAEPGARYDVVVSAEDEVAAQRLLPEFHAIFREPPVEEPIEEIQSSRVIEPIRRCRFPVMTLLFCGLCIVTFYGIEPQKALHSTAEPTGIAAWLVDRGEAIWNGYFWVPVTSTLVHESSEHLWSNLVLLLALGTATERILGHAGWLAFMLATAIAAPMCTLAWYGSVGYGSSGLAAACFGFTLLATIRQPTISLWILIPISLWIGYGTILDVANLGNLLFNGHSVIRTDSAAHLVGLLMGLLVAAGIVYQRRWSAGAIAALLVLGGIVPLFGTPWLTTWKYRHADRAWRSGDAAEGYRLYSELMERDPLEPAAYFARGLISLYDSKYDAAIADFTVAIQRKPSYADVRIYLSSAYVCQSKLDLALADVTDEIRHRPVSSRAYVQRAFVHATLANWVAAERDVTKAIQFDPQSSSAYAVRGALWKAIGRFSESLSDLDRALQIDPQNASALFQRGNLRSLQDDKELATADFLAAERIARARWQEFPRDALVVDEVALILCELERYGEALDWAEKATTLAPECFYCWTTRAICELQTEHAAWAAEYAAHAIRLNPRDAWAWQAQGEAQLALKDAAGAVKSFSTAIELNPRFFEAYQNRAEAYEALDDEAQAAADRAQAAELLGPPLARPGK